MTGTDILTPSQSHQEHERQTTLQSLESCISAMYLAHLINDTVTHTDEYKKAVDLLKVLKEGKQPVE